MVNPGILADEIQVETLEKTVRISMRVRSKAKLPERLWYEIPIEWAPEKPDSDPFLPPLMCCAFGLGLSLKVEASVSDKLLKGAIEAFERYRYWGMFIGDKFKKMNVEVGSSITRPESSGACASFYSGGVDSTFTIARNLRSYSAGDPRRVGAMIFVHGLDISLENEKHFLISDELARLSAFHSGCAYIPVKTNARTFAIARAEWLKYSHGPCLAGVGHLLAHKFKTIYMASTFSPAYLHPCSTDPEIDPLWSSERVEFIHDGFETPRSSKIRQLCQWNTDLSFLRVCWQNVDGMKNCGLCSKCVSTVFAFSCLKKDGQAKTMDPDLSMDKLRGMALKSGSVPFWQDNIDLAKQENRIDLAAEVEDVFKKHPAQMKEALWLYKRHAKARASRVELSKKTQEGK